MDLEVCKKQLHLDMDTEKAQKFVRVSTHKVKIQTVVQASETHLGRIPYLDLVRFDNISNKKDAEIYNFLALAFPKVVKEAKINYIPFGDPKMEFRFYKDAIYSLVHRATDKVVLVDMEATKEDMETVFKLAKNVKVLQFHGWIVDTSEELDLGADLEYQ